MLLSILEAQSGLQAKQASKPTFVWHFHIWTIGWQKGCLPCALSNATYAEGFGA